MSGIYISAANKSSGKTTLTVGICSALQSRGMIIQPFKKGPDYIDPMWLSTAAGRICYNLDFNVQSDDEILATVGAQQQTVDLNIVEGNKGLFDGVDVHGTDCNAALAKLLGFPVLLVIDAQGITRGIAPLLNGYQAFDAEVQYAGIVLNNTAGSRHESKLRKVIEAYTDFEVLGSVERNANLEIRERHMGLVTDKENTESDSIIASIRETVESAIDLDQLIEGATQSADSCQYKTLKQAESSQPNKTGESVKIGVAWDAAFCFYYQDDLDALRQHNVEVEFFSVLDDSELPEADGLFIGGGFPETHCPQLSKNRKMAQAIRNFAQLNKPIYAECGGLMYLARYIHWQDKQYEMAGIIPADIAITKKPVGRGLVELQPGPNHPWCVESGFSRSRVLPAHEFHYSKIINIDEPLVYAYDVKRGWGIDGEHDGVVLGNVFASYSHLRNTHDSPWVNAFLSVVRNAVQTN